jgi:uncharacterized protein (DUF1501 family)
MTQTSSRRRFLRAGAGAAALAGLQRLALVNAHAQAAPDYKALVCVFLYGGNDGHNMVVPQDAAAYARYRAARGVLALPDTNTQLLPVSTKAGVPYALNGGLSAIHPLWGQGKLAVLANVGPLAKPITQAQYRAGTVPVPSNLFSHPDQQGQMQAGNANMAGGTGWGGRATDALKALNGASSFPAAVSSAGPVLFCTGKSVPSASLMPGLDMRGSGMSAWPAAAAAARAQALQEILALDSGLTLVQAANKVRQDANALDALLQGTSGKGLGTRFPQTALGLQLQQVAQLIQVRAATGLSRQVFFCALGGFDTHSGQSWQQMDLLRQLAEALKAFYDATVEMGVAQQVTAFTESDFGRSLQPSGTGSDHGWGNHHLILGGAVRGGELYGSFPSLTLDGPNDATGRGVLIPTTSIEQYGATLAKWYGVSSADMATVFPTLAAFGKGDLGFMG